MSAIESILAPLGEELTNEFSKIQVGKIFDGLSSEDIEDMGGWEAIEEKKSELAEKMKSGMGSSMATSISKLASKLVLLTTGAVDFATRLLSIPLAIIGMGTTGPTISVNLILPLLKQLQGEARNLSSVYDDVDSSRKALQLEELGESNGVIKGVNDAIEAELKLVKYMVLLVGVRCGGEDAEEPEVNSPMSVDASECTNYRTDEEHMDTETYPKSAEYCLGFDPVMTVDSFKDNEEKTAQEQYDEWLQENRKCSCCKNYKK